MIYTALLCAVQLEVFMATVSSRSSLVISHVTLEAVLDTPETLLSGVVTIFYGDNICFGGWLSIICPGSQWMVSVTSDDQLMLPKMICCGADDSLLCTQPAKMVPIISIVDNVDGYSL
jgi:hypothetical protein